MLNLSKIPEIQSLDARKSLVRIPPEQDIPLTPRVRRILDTAEFRRLSQIPQLGLVSLVYPAANHTRFEHSLGVFRTTLLYLKHLAHDERFIATMAREDAEKLIVTALLHDLGHWPFCHPIEDLQLAGVPTHERLAESFLLDGAIASLLRSDWGIDPTDIVTLLSGKPYDQRSAILDSMLSGPIDVDKMDYLMRDSLHAGVPYGMNFDQGRLIGSLTLNEAGDGLAISEKGRTAAEMMVFARYVMFSEVYWHHAVRSATAMLQRAFYLSNAQLDLNQLFRSTEQPMIEQLVQAAPAGKASELLNGLFGSTRQLYKRLAQYSLFEDQDVYQKLVRRPYPWLAECSNHFAKLAGRQAKCHIDQEDILFDAPPVECEVDFNVDVFFPKDHRYRPLGDISPMVRTLAQEQFDDYVKRVRIFVHPRLVRELQPLTNIREIILEAADETERQFIQP